MTQSGLFITFEGGEGAGKSTQIQFLRDHLVAQGLDVILTREPGGTPEAEKIRELLVQRDGGNWAPEEEVLLFAAARHSHVKQVVLPALQENKIVICDRFTDSTRAYQSYGLGLKIDFIERLNDIVIDGLEPDLTFILDIDPEEGLLRSERRLADENSHEDRYERLDFTFHKKLRQGFLEIAQNNTERCHVISAAQSIEEVQTAIQNIWNAHYSNEGAP